MSSSKSSSESSTKMSAKIWSRTFCPNPKTVYPVDREDNGDTLVFDVQEVAPWTPKINASVGVNSDKNDDKCIAKDTLTCDDTPPLCTTPSMVDFLSVLDDKNDITLTSESSDTYKDTKEKKDEIIISWKKSDGEDERIIICIEDDP